MMKPYKQIGVPKWALEIRNQSPGTKGGQHANRNYTAVELRFNTQCLENESPDAFTHLQKIAAGRINANGILTITARRSRSQVENKKAAIDLLAGILKQAHIGGPPPRKPTKPTAASKVRRRTDKEHRSDLKRRRKEREVY